MEVVGLEELGFGRRKCGLRNWSLGACYCVRVEVTISMGKYLMYAIVVSVYDGAGYSLYKAQCMNVRYLRRQGGHQLGCTSIRFEKDCVVKPLTIK